MIKKLDKPLNLEGETIYELFRARDSPIGIAFAIIEESVLHYHKKTNEWYYIIKDAKMTLDDKILIFHPNEAVYIKSGKKHKIKKIKENVELLVISFPPWSKEDHYIIEK